MGMRKDLLILNEKVMILSLSLLFLDSRSPHLPSEYRDIGIRHSIHWSTSIVVSVSHLDVRRIWKHGGRHCIR